MTETATLCSMKPWSCRLFVYFSLLIVKQIFVELCLLPMAIAGPYPSHVLPPMNAEIVSRNDFQVTSIHYKDMYLYIYQILQGTEKVSPLFFEITFSNSGFNNSQNYFSWNAKTPDLILMSMHNFFFINSLISNF